jgi:hypothetical protein
MARGWRKERAESGAGLLNNFSSSVSQTFDDLTKKLTGKTFDRVSRSASLPKTPWILLGQCRYAARYALIPRLSPQGLSPLSARPTIVVDCGGRDAPVIVDHRTCSAVFTTEIGNLDEIVHIGAANS